MKDENKNTKLKFIFFLVNIIANGNIEFFKKLLKENLQKSK